MHLIVGLGNPGRRYALTRHNIGFEVINYLAEQMNLGKGSTKFEGLHYSASFGSHRTLLLKPLTYMNLSGLCVKNYVDYFSIPLENILIIYDDTSFDVGTFRIRKTGSAGGHNGMDNIIYHLGTEHIARIRIGIGAAVYDKKNYVLSRFSPEEIPAMQQAVIESAKATQTFVREGVDQAMNTHNLKMKKQSPAVLEE